MQEIKFIRLEDINQSQTSHGSGQKQVFISNIDTRTCLTQFAFGTLKHNEGCEEHTHPSMDEYFYFISGNGEYHFEEYILKIVPKMFLKIPSNTKHSIKNTGKKKLEFIYFGISLNDKLA